MQWTSGRYFPRRLVLVLLLMGKETALWTVLSTKPTKRAKVTFCIFFRTAIARRLVSKLY
jgi:hypothetical protein